jgi:ABC-2 type transport system permease protein
MTGTAAHYAALSRRSIIDTIRQPTSVIPSLLFPLLFLAMSSAAFNESTRLPGFPQVESFTQFVITTTIIQGALFGSISAGAAMATDIENGFFERLVASPVTRTSIMAGRVAGAALFAFIQAWIYLGITTLFGLDVAGGIIAMLLIATVGATVAAGFGSISVAFALRTGSAEAVQGSFPLLFAFLLLSSAFFPRALMNGWFETVATINPLSHLIEGLRSLVIDGLNFDDFLRAAFIAALLFSIGTVLALIALRGRLAAHA